MALRSRLPGDDKSVKFVVLDGDGRRRFELTKPNVPWSSAPVALDSGRLCVSVSARTIELVDLQNGKPIWSFETIGSDRPAQPIVAQGALLILVGGTELIRVDAETGKRLWSAHIASQPIPDAPTAWAVDDHMFYCITREQNLRAFRVDDGTLAWQLSLVGSQEHWQIVPATRHLAVLPDRPDATHELPVVLCRKSDGQLGQRLLFRSHGGDAFVHLARDFALVGTENEVWAVGGPER